MGNQYVSGCVRREMPTWQGCFGFAQGYSYGGVARRNRAQMAALPKVAPGLTYEARIKGCSLEDRETEPQASSMESLCQLGG